MLRKVKFSGWLVSVFIVSLLMNFTVILPSNADVVDNNFHLISLISKSTTTQSFDPEKVRLGITPTGWSNSDDLTIDLEPPVPMSYTVDYPTASGVWQMKTTRGTLYTLNNFFRLDDQGIVYIWPMFDPKAILNDPEGMIRWLTGENY